MTQDPRVRPYDSGETLKDAPGEKGIDVERPPESLGERETPTGGRPGGTMEGRKGNVEETYPPAGMRDKPSGDTDGRAETDDGGDYHGLLESSATGRYRERWDSLQASFVDRPRESVKEAEQLLDEVFSSLSDAFRKQRSGLEEKWSSGGEPSTEDLRLAVRRYRSLFQRLLNA
jgi:hypothetical protein